MGDALSCILFRPPENARALNEVNAARGPKGCWPPPQHAKITGEGSRSRSSSSSSSSLKGSRTLIPRRTSFSQRYDSGQPCSPESSLQRRAQSLEELRRDPRYRHHIEIHDDRGPPLSAFYLRRGLPVTLFFCHGNAEDLDMHSTQAWLKLLHRALQVDVFAFEYHGYGPSKHPSRNRPSERRVYSDSLRAFDHLTNALEVDPRQVVLFGRSLGAVVACHLGAILTGPAGAEDSRNAERAAGGSRAVCLGQRPRVQSLDEVSRSTGGVGRAVDARTPPIADESHDVSVKDSVVVSHSSAASATPAPAAASASLRQKTAEVATGTAGGVESSAAVCAPNEPRIMDDGEDFSGVPEFQRWERPAGCQRDASDRNGLSASPTPASNAGNFMGSCSGRRRQRASSSELGDELESTENDDERRFRHPAAHLIRGVILQSIPLSAFRIAFRNLKTTLPGDCLVTVDIAHRLRAPTLFIHGGKDLLIPLSHGQQLWSSVPTEFRVPPLWIPEAGHNDIEYSFTGQVLARLSIFLNYETTTRTET